MDVIEDNFPSHGETAAAIRGEAVETGKLISGLIQPTVLIWMRIWQRRKLNQTGLNKSICGCKKKACEDSARTCRL